MAEKKNQNRSDCFSHSQLTEEACSGNRAGAGFFACAKKVRKLALSAAGSENFHLFESRTQPWGKKKDPERDLAPGPCLVVRKMGLEPTHRSTGS